MPAYSELSQKIPDTFAHLEHDLRYQALRKGLSQLEVIHLQRLRSYLLDERAIVCDSFNYDQERELWCPLAIALDVPQLLSRHEVRTMTNENAKMVISEIGRSQLGKFTLNPMSGIPGNFFRQNRVYDLQILCKKILEEKLSVISSSSKMGT
jgi:hypothetical protein